nr:LlaJI family restriction endonuclease [uncultured Leptotrichia sp.]
MKVNKLQELQSYSISECQSIFDLSEDETREVLKTLAYKNIVRKMSKNLSSAELEELNNGESFEQLNKEFEGDNYKFKFVGIITVKDVCLIIYPKYISGFDENFDKDNKIIKQLIEVMRKYESKEQKQFLSNNEKNKNYNLLALAIDLYDDYHINGLYSNEKTIIEENGEGEILWDKTINEKDAYFINDVPFYLDFFSVNKETNEEDFFRRLHRCIITESYSKIEEIFDILDYEPINISDDEIDYFGDKEYIITRLNQEMSRQFIDKKQKQLNMMKNYFLETENSNEDEEIKFIGTTSFNLVWEKVCAIVLGNSLDKKLEDLGLDTIDNTRNITLKEVISKPEWKVSNSDIKHQSSKTLIPDLIVYNKEDRSISIYDAKYYNIILTEKLLKNYPGVEDISKQYLYELAYRDLIKRNNLKIKENAFIMPTDKKMENQDTLFEEIGEVEFDIFENMEFKSVRVKLASATKMYEKYLKSEKG